MNKKLNEIVYQIIKSKSVCTQEDFEAFVAQVIPEVYELGCSDESDRQTQQYKND